MTEPATPQKPTQGARVPVRLADGRVGTVQQGELQQTLDAGGQVVDQSLLDKTTAQAKYGGVGDAFAAGGLGAARGASLGLSDYVAGELLGKDYVSGVQKANPIASTVGEVGGVILPSLLTAGEYTPIGLSGALARGGEGIAARALGEGLLAKAGGMAVGGAIEGGLMGAGGAVSEAALGDEGLTAEKLLAGAGSGALAGGALGGGLGLAGGLAGRAVRGAGEGLAKLGSGALGRIEGKTGSEIAGELSGKYAFSATGAGARDYAALARKGRDVSETGNFLLDQWSAKAEKPFWQASREDVAEFGRRLKSEMGDEMGAATRLIDAEAKAAAKAELQPIVATGNFIKRAESDVLTKLAESPVYTAEAKKIAGLIDDFKFKAGLDVDIAGLRQAAASGGPEAAGAAARLADAEARQGAVTYEKLHQWRHELDTKINWNNPEIKPLNEAHKAMRQIAEQEIERAAAGLGDNVGSAYTGAKKNFIKAADIEKSATAGAARQTAARDFGMSEQLGLIQGLVGSGSSLGGLAVSAGQWGVKHYGNQIAASVLRKASTLESMQRAVVRTDALKDTAIKSFFSRQSATMGAKAGTLAGIARRIEAVQQDAATPPQNRTDPHAPDPLVAPKTSFAYQQARSQAVNWLAMQVPQGTPKTPLIPTIRNEPSKSQLMSWNAKADVFEDPIGTIGYAMKTGTLRAEHVDALDAMYPKLAEDMRRSFHQALISVTSQKNLPSGAKLRQLGILLRTPATPDQEPQFIQSQQAIYQQAAQESQAADTARNTPTQTKHSDLTTGEDELG